MTADTHAKPERRRNRLRSAACVLGWCALVLVTLWGVAALYVDVRAAALRVPLAVAYGLGMIAVWLWVRRPLKAIITAGGFVVVLLWWSSLQPSNDRDWQPDLAVLPYADIAGNEVTIHNIRNCDYRSETDYDVRHYDKTFHLDKLHTVDFYMVYWGSPAICHTMLSFGFGDEGYACISIETRKERGEGYSTIKGFFKQFELTYVIADERDLVRLRTNYRGEQVHLYRLNTPSEVIRKVFLDYLKEVNSLKERPEWYNALTSNCTSNIRGHTKPFAAKSRWSWKLVVNGYLDELTYDNGALDRSLPLAELKQRSLINGRGQAADKDPEFSRRIREGLPGFDP